MEIAAVPSEYLEAELVAHAAFEATGMARMLDVLAEFDRRRVWESWGCVSAQQWLGWKCGLGYGAASERLRVARALTVLPCIRHGLSRGKLSYSKVRELTRIATPDTDECLAGIAGAATAAQVATMVRSLRRRTPKDVARQVESRGLRWELDDADGSMVFTLRLATEVGQAVLAAVNTATEIQAGVPAHQSRADACARLICGDDEVRARPEVIVHLHGDAASFEDSTAVAPEIVECLACDGPVTTVVDTQVGPVTIKKDPPPSRAQRRWLRLRHRTCQFPGCHHSGSFDAHHIVHRSLGGKTRLNNMVRLCQFHHRLVHILDLRLTLHPDRHLEVTFPAGNPVDRTIDTIPFAAPTPSINPGALHIASSTHRTTDFFRTSRCIRSSAFSLRNRTNSARSSSRNAPGICARRRLSTQLPSVPSCTPSSRAISATGRPVVNTMSTAPSLKS